MTKSIFIPFLQLKASILICHLGRLKIFWVEVLDIRGKPMRFFKYINNDETFFEIPIANYATGIYILRISTPDGKLNGSYKFIKE